MLLLLLVLAADDPVSNPWAWGAGGIAAASLALGKFAVPRWTYDRERERADRMEAKVDKLEAELRQTAIPALVTSTSAVEKAMDLMRDLRADRRAGE